MLYALLFYGREEEWIAKEPPERERIINTHLAEVNEALRQGALITTARLLDTSAATTVRSDGKTVLVTDGPFAETKEQFGGLQILDCADRDEAIRYAKMFAAAGGVVEIRPVHPNPGDWDTRPQHRRKSASRPRER